MKKKILTVVCALSLAFGCSSAVFAGVSETTGGTETNSTSTSTTYDASATVNGHVTSNTGANVTTTTVTASGTNVANYIASLEAAFTQVHADVLAAILTEIPGRTASYTINGPALVSNSVTNTDTQTVAQTLAAGTIVIGDDSGGGFVAAGNVNTNLNTNTHSDINQAWVIEGYKLVSPLVLNLDGSDTIQASGGNYLPHPGQFYDSRTAIFDFYGNNFPVAMEWVGPKDGLLCVPNADGSVNGASLFGTSTGYQNGYEHLASRDANLDLNISGAELDGLYVWQDANSNARAEASELTTVQELGITEINVNHRQMKSSFVMNGEAHTMYDWWPTVLKIRKIKLN